MPRPMPEGWKRPVAQETEREYVGGKIPLTSPEVLKRIPANWLEGLRNNTKAKSCCREPKNFTYQLMKTDKALKEPNMAILECKCGARHIHAAAGGSGTKT